MALPSPEAESVKPKIPPAVNAAFKRPAFLNFAGGRLQGRDGAITADKFTEEDLGAVWRASRARRRRLSCPGDVLQIAAVAVEGDKCRPR